MKGEWRLRRLPFIVLAVLAVGACSSPGPAATATALTANPSSTTVNLQSQPSTTAIPATIAAPTTSTVLEVCVPSDADAPVGIWPVSTWMQACSSLETDLAPPDWFDELEPTVEAFLAAAAGWDTVKFVSVIVSEDGRSGYVVVEPEGADGHVVLTAAHPFGDDWWVVGSVWMEPGEHPPSYSLVGNELWLGVSDDDADAVVVDVLQGNAEASFEAEPDSNGALILVDRDPSMPSAVIVKWVSNGAVVRLEGFAVPAGDSAAG